MMSGTATVRGDSVFLILRVLVVVALLPALDKWTGNNGWISAPNVILIVNAVMPLRAAFKDGRPCPGSRGLTHTRLLCRAAIAYSSARSPT